jgi:hypothetical protein
MFIFHTRTQQEATCQSYCTSIFKIAWDLGYQAQFVFFYSMTLLSWTSGLIFRCLTVSGVSISYADDSVHMTTEAYCELAAARRQESVLGWTAWLWGHQCCQGCTFLCRGLGNGRVAVGKEWSDGHVAPMDAGGPARPRLLSRMARNKLGPSAGQAAMRAAAWATLGSRGERSDMEKVNDGLLV